MWTSQSAIASPSFVHRGEAVLSIQSHLHKECINGHRDSSSPLQRWCISLDGTLRSCTSATGLCDHCFAADGSTTTNRGWRVLRVKYSVHVSVCLGNNSQRGLKGIAITHLDLCNISGSSKARIRGEATRSRILADQASLRLSSQKSVSTARTFARPRFFYRLISMIGHVSHQTRQNLQNTLSWGSVR